MTPHLAAVLQVRPHRAEGQDHLPGPAGHDSLDAAQDTVGFWGCEDTLLAHVQLFKDVKYCWTDALSDAFFSTDLLVSYGGLAHMKMSVYLTVLSTWNQ